MKPRNGAIVGLLFLATCSEDFQVQDPSSNIESSEKALGKVPASEVAVWAKSGSSVLPDARYLQTAAFDSDRGVVVMFGGIAGNTNMGPTQVTPNAETWEWNPKTGKWANRTGTTKGPDARSGAAMVYDSDRKKMLLFGGRAGSGFNLEDTWEWEPTTGAWTNVSAAGGHPSARSQAGMVYLKGANKVLLFGGGRSDTNSYDGTGISASLGDTWLLDTSNYTWTQLTLATSPSVRHDFGIVWDATNGQAILFGGMQTDIAGASGIPKQDTWVFKAADSTWTDKTAAGAKPTQRYAHAMAFDGSRGKVLLFGGLDMSTGGSLNDLWELDAATFAWTERLTGTEAGVPSARMYASFVSDDAGRLELLAGAAYSYPGGMGGRPIGVGYGMRGTREVWDLEPTKPAFTDRTVALDVPGPRYYQCMAYNPSAQKTYLFGGYDQYTGQSLDDLWEWNGKVWAQVAVDVRPPARSDAALAYDPARKSLILYGGNDNYSGQPFDDTWEFVGGKWTQLKPKASPDPLAGHRMVTDMGRGKVLLFGGVSTYNWNPGIYKSPVRNDVWEWDGGAMTWTNRSPTSAASMPQPRYNPIVSFDEGRQKLFVFDGTNFGGSATAFWEWDTTTAGWESRNTGDSTKSYGYYMFAAYDSIRRRQVLLTDSSMSPSSSTQDTWEIDAKGPTLYIRTLSPSPGTVYGASMVFDSARGVVILYGGQNMNTGMPVSDTWEYKVSNLGNGEGCTGDFASSCATGFCVEGVCCEAASCTGACKSCSVAGSEGTCVLAKAGTEVAGSCESGMACDGTGSCKAKNGQACTTADGCASGFCADGVCCDGACTGACASCNQAGRAGKCSPYAAGSDPQNECGKGTGVCKSACDGVNGCAYPQYNVICGDCMLCNGIGDCSVYDYSCSGMGGYIGGSGGSYPRGGAGGIIVGGSGGSYPRGGSGGTRSGGAGGAGGSIPMGGSGGVIIRLGGSTGTVIGGAGGALPQAGATGNPGAGGSTIPVVPGEPAWDGSVPAKGGSTGAHDGGTGIDGGGSTPNLKSGCSCEVGGGLAGSAWSTPLFLIGAVLLFRRRRRRS